MKIKYWHVSVFHEGSRAFVGQVYLKNKPTEEDLLVLFLPQFSKDFCESNIRTFRWKKKKTSKTLVIIINHKQRYLTSFNFYIREKELEILDEASYELLIKKTTSDDAFVRKFACEQIKKKGLQNDNLAEL